MNPGDILDGRYEIEARLGAGGMGEVYRAKHALLGTSRVIKVVRSQIAGSTDAQERFLREAKIATRVQHPNVATLHDFASLPDGSHYMVWEYIDGENLAQRLRSHGTMSPRTAVRLAIEALHGLDAIHRAGIIHRDISPENLMLTADDSVKIIDLGVAKIDDPEAVSSTRTGIFVGKLRYSAPEQLGFLPEGEKIDGRTDIYAMAMVLIELMTGRPPYEAKSPHEYFLHHAREVQQTTIELPSSFASSDALEKILLRALARDRGQRFATAREFAAALQAIVPGLPDDLEAKTVLAPLGGDRTTVSKTLEGKTEIGSRDAVTEILTSGAATVQTPVPASAPPPQSFAGLAAQPNRSARGPLLAVVLVAALVLGGGAYALWPKLSGLIAPKPESKPQQIASIPQTAPPAAAVEVTPATESAAVVPATVDDPVADPLSSAPAARRPAPRQETDDRPPIPSREEVEAAEESPRARRRVPLFFDGSSGMDRNERALDSLREDLRGVDEVALRAGGLTVALSRAIRRAIPGIRFSAESDVVIVFDATPLRLGRERRHLAAAATITKGGEVICRYENASAVGPEAAAESFAQMLAAAMEEN